MSSLAAEEFRLENLVDNKNQFKLFRFKCCHTDHKSGWVEDSYDEAEFDDVVDLSVSGNIKEFLHAVVIKCLKWHFVLCTMLPL